MTEADLQAVLLDLEVELLTEETRHSEARLRELLADDFVEFGSSGRVYDKQSIIDELLQSQSTENFKLDDFRLLYASDDAAFVIYSCVAVSKPGEIARKSIRCSLWRLQDGDWEMVFHQGTKTG